MEIAHEESVEEVSQDLRDLEGSDARTDRQARRWRRSYAATTLRTSLLTNSLKLLASPADEAKALIMKAREHWFTNDAAS